MSNVHHFAAQEILIGEKPFVGRMMANGLESSSAISSSATSGKSYKVTTKKGTHNGIGASVSGAGAVAKVKGSFAFSARTIDHSQKYQELKTKYNIQGGTSGFFSWLLGYASAGASHEEVQTTMEEMTRETITAGTVNIDLTVTGQIPNFQVDASAYVLLMSVTDDQGNTYEFASSSDSKGDTGATNSSAMSPDQQPVVTDNNSTINI